MDQSKKKGPKKVAPKKGAKLTLNKTDLRRLVEGLVIIDGGGTKTTRGPGCPLSPVMQTCGAGDPCHALRGLLRAVEDYRELDAEGQQQVIAAALWLAKR